MKFKFYTAKRKDGVFLRLNVNFGRKVLINGEKKYKPVFFNLPDTFPADLWDKESQRLSEKSKFTDAKKINAKLVRLEAAMKDYKLLKFRR